MPITSSPCLLTSGSVPPSPRPSRRLRGKAASQGCKRKNPGIPDRQNRIPQPRICFLSEAGPRLFFRREAAPVPAIPASKNGKRLFLQLRSICCKVLVQIGNRVALDADILHVEGNARRRDRIDPRRVVDEIGVEAGLFDLVDREVPRELGNDRADHLKVSKFIRPSTIPMIRPRLQLPLYQLVNNRPDGFPGFFRLPAQLVPTA